MRTEAAELYEQLMDHSTPMYFYMYHKVAQYYFLFVLNWHFNKVIFSSIDTMSIVQWVLGNYITEACTQRGLVCRKSSCGPSALHRQTVTLQRQWSLDPALVTFRPNIMHEPLMTEESCKEKSCNASLKSEAQQSRLIDDQPSLTLMRHCCPRPGPVHCIQEFLLTAPLSLILFAFSTTGTVGFNYFTTKWYRWKIGVCN